MASVMCKLLVAQRFCVQSTKYLSTLKFVETGEITFAQPPSFDFLSDGYGARNIMWDPTAPRFHDNTKVLAVEGNIGSGKSFLASRLAEYFGLLHFPDPTEDDIYIFKRDKPLYDLRSHNYILPKSAKYYTCEMFWNEPDLINKGKPLYLQFQFYIRRFWNYSKAMSILLNTGRGFIVDRSLFSDLAFAEALYNCGYMSERACRWFKQNHAVTCRSLWKPHLLIYIKATKEQIREHMRKRNIPWELNGCNMTDKFLDAYADALEKSYLARMKRYSEVLVIDGSTIDVYNEDDVRVIAQQVSEVPLVCDRKLRDDYKFSEWQLGLWNNDAMHNARHNFSNASLFLKAFQKVTAPSDLLEYRYSYEDRGLQASVMQMDPRTAYPPSYNPMFNNVLDIILGSSKTERNFKADLPKGFLWP